MAHRGRSDAGEAPQAGKTCGRGRRRYGDEFRAEALAALAANGGNVKRTARQLGLPRKTLEGWASGRTAPPPAELRHQKRESLARALERIAWRILDETPWPEKIAAAPLQDIAVAAGIIVDKMMVLRADGAARPTTGGGVLAG